MFEAATMLVLPHLAPWSGGWSRALLDSTVLVLTVAPALYTFFYRPMARELAKRAQAELASRENESKYRALFEQATDGIFISDAQGHYVDVNPSGCSMLGYTRDELLGMSIGDLLPPEDLAAAPMRLADLRAGRVVVSERRLLRKDATLVATEVSANLLPDGRLQGIARDITERKRAEAELHRRARQLEAIAEVGGLVTGGGDPQATLESLARKVAEIARVDAVTVRLLDEERSEPVLAAYSSAPMKSIGASRGAGVRWWRSPSMRDRLKNRAHLLFDDLQTDPRLSEELRALAREDGIQSLLVLPLFFGNDLMGTLGLACRERRTFTADDLQLLSTLAGQTAAAVKNARLLWETQRRFRETSLLLDLSEQLLDKSRAEDMFAPILEHTAAGLWAEGASVHALDSRRGEVRVCESRGAFETLADNTCALAQMPPVCAMHTGEPCFGVENCPLLPSTGATLRVACVAFKLGDRVLGGLHVGTTCPEGFGAGDLALLKGIADIAASALHRAQLFEEVRLYRDAFNSTVEAISITDLNSVILDVNPGFERLTGFNRAEAVGAKTSLIKSPQTSLEFYRAMWADILARGFWSGEIINRRKNGEAWHSLLTVSTVRDERGRPVAFMGINRDITERKRHEREREALITAAAALRVAKDRADMLPVILEQTTMLLDAPDAALAICDPVTGDTLVEIGMGPLGARGIGQRLSPGTGISGHVIQSGQPYRSDDISADPRLAVPELVTEPRAVACVPLVAHGKAIGALWVVRPTPVADDELRLLTAIADMAANALHRATLHELTERRLRQVQGLRQIEQAITGNLDLRVILSVLLDQATTQLGVDAAAVLLISPHARTLEPIAARGFRGQGLPSEAVRLGESQAGRAALERRVVQVPSLSDADPPFVRARLVTEEGFVAYAAAPLIAKGEMRGVLELFHRAQLRPDPDWLELLNALAGQAAMAIDNSELFQGLQRSNAELALAYDTTLEGWSRALDLRDKETEGHTQRVTELAMRLAQAAGLGQAELLHVRRGALLHDIGKMGVPDRILHKPGPLADDEWAIMRRHPVLAYEMLAPIAYLRPALDIPYCHHEKWDGTGYPRGLRGEQIPLAARIFAVADVWDALTSDRPYRKAWPAEQAREHIRDQAGKHFDPRVVEAFLAISAGGAGP